MSPFVRITAAMGECRGARGQRGRFFWTWRRISGGPAISVPCGLTPGGMPVGLQIASAPGRDKLVLRLAAAYEHEAASHSSDRATIDGGDI